MKASQIRALANIADKPGASVSTQLIAMRRVCRLFCHERATIHQERRALRRKAAKLKAFLPFTAAAVANLEQQARGARSRIAGRYEPGADRDRPGRHPAKHQYHGGTWI